MALSMKFNIWIVIATLFLALGNMILSYGCGENSQGQDIGSILGTLVDTDGTTILPGKRIEIAGINGAIGIATGATNVNGQFSFINIPIGTYIITAKENTSAATFIASKDVTVNKGETETITIVKGEVAPPTPTPTVTTTPTATPTP